MASLYFRFRVPPSTLVLASTLTLVAVCALVPLVGANNVCYLEQGGCKYRVTVLPAACGTANDEPWGEEGEENEEGGRRMGGRLISEDTGVPDTGSAAAAAAAAEASFKRLDGLEQKLVKMMEELSVRSLRHIREIRSDLRHVSASMTHLKGATKKSGLGGTLAGGGGMMMDAASTPRRCPTDFLGVGNWKSCYRFSNFEATWHEAREYCSAFGASLLILDSMKEAYIIDYLIKSNPAFEEPKGWWTSGQYVVRNQRWMWQEGGGGGGGGKQVTAGGMKTIDFSRWAPGEPNARSTMHCMILYKQAKYFWHDATCTDKHSFICEMDSQ